MAAGEGPVFQQRRQVWNHTFYWRCMKPNGGGEPTARSPRPSPGFRLLREVQGRVHDASVSQFGSGWGWLVMDQGKLKVTKTGNADLP